MTARQNRQFENKEFTLSQFGLLNHFTHVSDKSWTITDLASPKLSLHWSIKVYCYRL
jgi:hypothetical protein